MPAKKHAGMTGLRVIQNAYYYNQSQWDSFGE